LRGALAAGIFAWSGNPLWFLFAIGIASMRYKVGIDTVWVATGTSLLAAAPLAYAFPEFAVTGLAAAAIIAFVSLESLPQPFAFLGMISYSLYLVHVPIGARVVNLGLRFGGSEPYKLALSLTALAITILFAWLFYLAIERPATRMATAIAYRPARSPGHA
jgi:peptidoglycan/LPS O-acetylase OafA/YrhL